MIPHCHLGTAGAIIRHVLAEPDFFQSLDVVLLVQESELIDLSRSSSEQLLGYLQIRYV